MANVSGHRHLRPNWADIWLSVCHTAGSPIVISSSSVARRFTWCHPGVLRRRGGRVSREARRNSTTNHHHRGTSLFLKASRRSQRPPRKPFFLPPSKASTLILTCAAPRITLVSSRLSPATMFPTTFDGTLSGTQRPPQAPSTLHAGIRFFNIDQSSDTQRAHLQRFFMNEFLPMPRVINIYDINRTASCTWEGTDEEIRVSNGCRRSGTSHSPMGARRSIAPSCHSWPASSSSDCRLATTCASVSATVVDRAHIPYVVTLACRSSSAAYRGRTRKSDTRTHCTRHRADYP